MKPLHPRSPKWPKVAAAFLKGKRCACCGKTIRLNAHHKKPFHLFPELELDPNNLMALCVGTFACHLLIGHLGSWKSYNETAVEDAAYLNHKIKTRP